MSYYREWKAYVPVAQRRAQAQRKMAALRKKGANIQPIEIEGRKIARTFWGEGWCDHLESFSDYENRLPRGRTYVRNGSVCHLAMKKGKIEAKVAGSGLYDVRIKIKTLSAQRWAKIKKECAGQIGSLLELLQGNLSDNIMAVVTDRKNGLFPEPAEIQFDCSCPDWANMCKHVAAALYGVGARLDNDPSLLFRLRDVDHEELIKSQVAVPAGTGTGKSKRLTSANLGDVFGIELDTTADEFSSATKPPKKGVRTTTKKSSSRKKASVKKATVTKSAKKEVAKKKSAKKSSAKKSTSQKVSTRTKAAKKKAAKRTTLKGTKQGSSSKDTRRKSKTKASRPAAKNLSRKHK